MTEPAGELTASITVRALCRTKRLCQWSDEADGRAPGERNEEG